MNKIRLGVLFGGISVEHEVSVITGVQLLKNAHTHKYDLFPIYVDKSGQFWYGQELFDINYYKNQDLFSPQGLTKLDWADINKKIDMAILCFHGQYGEGGAIQGLLELLKIPYQGPNLTASAICFDKLVTRQILATEKISQPQFTFFSLDNWQKYPDMVIKNAKTLGFPLYVKPINGGSSIGVEKIGDDKKLADALERVFQFDNRILMEKEVIDCIEVNVSVLGTAENCHASVPEQPIKSADFLSFADKYEKGGGKKSGMASLSRRIPAPISDQHTKMLQDISMRVFRIFNLSGVVRIDYFINPSSGEYYLIEINSIPGSMSFYLWQASGMSYSELIDKLVDIAQKEFAQKENLIHSFDTNIIKNS